MHVSPVCSQHSFGLPPRMNGMHRKQFDHVCLDLRVLTSSHVKPTLSTLVQSVGAEAF